MTRKPLIAANWKMYKTPEEARSFFRIFLPLVKDALRDEIVICPPTLDIPASIESARGSQVHIGAQNMHFADEGAFTGETSAVALASIGVTHVLIGHSERRQYFSETDESVNRKLVAALKHRLIPIVCVGEHLEQRESGKTEEVLNLQVGAALAQIDPSKLSPLVIAYEPVWAIGTGKTATPEMAAEAHLLIRNEVARMVGRKIADDLRILYGGSVKPENAASLLNQPEIDGALVGGASLDPHSFYRIVASA